MLQSEDELNHSQRDPVKARRLLSQISVLDIPVGHQEKKPPNFTVRIVKHCSRFCRDTKEPVLSEILKT